MKVMTGTDATASAPAPDGEPGAGDAGPQTT